MISVPLSKLAAEILLPLIQSIIHLICKSQQPGKREDDQDETNTVFCPDASLFGLVGGLGVDGCYPIR